MILRRLLPGLVVFLGAVARADLARAEDEPLDVREVVRELLVVEPVGQGTRTGIVTDALEALRVRGAWSAPKEGDVLEVPRGPSRTWRRLVADEKGVFPADPAFRGGYACATVASERERVAILESSGSRHVYVNGEPRVGDVYGSIESRLPVLLRAGGNELLFRCGRGPLRARLVEPPADLYLTDHDATVPDVWGGEHGILYDLGVGLVNASLLERRDVVVVASVEGGDETENRIAFLPPLSHREVPLRVHVPGGVPGPRVTVTLRIRGDARAVEIPLDVKRPEDKHKRTFVSRIDGSVQYYALTPAQPEPGEASRPALVMTLHGASVEAAGQANAYAHKPWATIVAPTNRRPFGFDWEDWGRIDAMEVLARAEAETIVDPRRVYLTGHSMGGHGTWMIGAQSPGRFAAIAPSAGWRDFWAYGGAGEVPKDDPVLAILDRAANPHRLRLWEANLATSGIYVLHGDADDNVPVSEARAMRERLGTFHPNFAYYEKPGAGHWWGNQCVDWPPLFDFLRQNVLPVADAIRHVSYVTVDPGICSGSSRIHVGAQIRALQPSRVQARLSDDLERVEITTENVRTLRLLAEDHFEAADSLAAGRVTVIDGQELAPGATFLVRSDHGRWRVRRAEDGAGTGREKRPRVSGPFKHAFRNRMTFVYGTRGTPQENTWSFAKARYDAEQFWYRGNGGVAVLPDTEVAAAAPPGNLVLYGHREMNAAWALLAEGCPLDVRRGRLTVGERRMEGDDLACLFVFPGRGEARLVAVVAGTGLPGLATTDQLPYFTSGVAYPDWCVLSADMLTTGAAGLLGAGFLDWDWSLGSDHAWRE